ncbi:Predicted transcriptional regulator, ArsR family [Pelagirhabdus alkalitolerans]|uniref:Predicted transcriptional regulator, ArsR family n=1 Tax=Pelagirhabdus alkalitolerans TaxID=1612202 RepID=A0A1G6IF93_9BACI|nr:transcriptional regulator [Pelagirhabdus alkalitolerans]SDC05141.1 Predicted transcriptional regulator, ArsR family [Pelagirhabdus alkalitolerans]
MAKDQSTREAILELLKKKKELSVSGLKEYLDITEMAVRKHLVKLEGEGYITSRTVRQPMGRPVIFYRLTDAGHGLFPNNYDQLVIEMLQDIQETIGNDAIDELFQKREARMLRKYKRHIYDEDSLRERVKQLVDIQKDNGYMAEFTEESDLSGESTVTFEQFNCPIAAISSRYDTPCQCELELFKEALNTDHIERVTCIAKGEKSCKYVIKESQSHNQTT